MSSLFFGIKPLSLNHALGLFVVLNLFMCVIVRRVLCCVCVCVCVHVCVDFVDVCVVCIDFVDVVDLCVCVLCVLILLICVCV